MLKTLKKSKKKRDIDAHLLYIFKNTTSEERLIWLTKAFAFWKMVKKDVRSK